MPADIEIGPKKIGRDEDVYIIAEAGVNHDGSLRKALELVDVAVAAGADAVKFQSFSAKSIVTRSAQKAEYQRHTTDDVIGQRSMLESLELSCDEEAEISRYAAGKGIEFISSPFDIEHAEILKELGVNCIKISSGCLTYTALLEKAASFGLPVIISTGMAELNEVSEAVNTLRSSGCRDLILMQCVTDYPADISDVNLRAMLSMRREYDVHCGYSDHTCGDEAALAAVALGAVIIEKHITLNRADAGPDHATSALPDEFKRMVERIRKVRSALGDGIKRPSVSEMKNREACRYSVVAAREIKAGTVLSEADLLAKRPGSGIQPRMMSKLVGMTASASIPEDTLIDWSMVESRI